MAIFGQVLVALALAAYAGATALFVVHLLSHKSGFAQRGLTALVVGTSAHALAQVVRFIDVGVVLAISKTDALHLLSLVLAVSFIGIAKRYKVPALGAFAAPICLVSLGAWLLLDSSGAEIPQTFRSALLIAHIAVLLTAEAFFLVAGIASVAYLLQDNALKKKKLGPLFKALPSLHVLDEIAHRTIVLGWVLLTTGMVLGLRQAKLEWGAYWQWDPRQSVTALIWLLFAGILHARLITGWRGRRAVYLTIFSVCVVVGSHLFLDVFFDTMHAGDYR